MISLRSPAFRLAAHAALGLAVGLPSSAAQSCPQAPESSVVASNTSVGASFGTFDADVHYLAAGAPDSSTLATGAGEVYYFQRDGDEWREDVRFVASDGLPGDALGAAIAVSPFEFLAGAPSRDELGVDSGAVYVFEDNGSGWFEALKLTAADTAAGDAFGSAIALQPKRRAIIGAPGADALGVDSGSAYLFRKIRGVWSEESRLLPADGQAGDAFGSAIEIRFQWIVVGAPNHDVSGNDAGAVYLYQLTNNVPVLVQKITASDAAAGDQFGVSVDLRDDRLLVGAPGKSGRAGAVYVFEFDGVQWIERSQWTAPVAQAGDAFGSAVDIQETGPAIGRQPVAVVGAPGRDRGAGAAYVFLHDDGAWWLRQELIGAGNAGDATGTAVAWIHEGPLVAAPGDDSAAVDAGAIHLYSSRDETRPTTEVVTASNGTSFDRFGESMSLLEDGLLAVSAPGADGAMPETGAVYIFDHLTRKWRERSIVTASDGQGQDAFGRSLVLSRQVGRPDQLVVGAPGHDTCGAVYVYERTSTGWRETQKLLPPFVCDGSFTHKSFGAAVAASGEFLVVGAPGAFLPRLEYDTGVVLVYRRINQAWELHRTLLSNDPTVSVRFGLSIAIQGSTLFVGAPLDSALGNGAGALYRFELNQAQGGSAQIIRARDTDAGDLFGHGVVVDGDRLLVSATGVQIGNNVLGAAYVFERRGNAWVETGKPPLSGPIGVPRMALRGDTMMIATNDSQALARIDVLRHDGVQFVPTESLSLDQPRTAGGAASVLLGPDSALIGAAADSRAGLNAGAVHVAELSELFLESSSVQASAGEVVEFNLRSGRPLAPLLLSVVAVNGRPTWIPLAPIRQLDHFGSWEECVTVPPALSRIRLTLSGISVGLNGTPTTTNAVTLQLR